MPSSVYMPGPKSGLDWVPAHDEAGNLVSLKAKLENLEFTIFKTEPEGQEWIRWVLAGPLWDDVQFLCTNSYYWSAVEYGENLIASKLNRLSATFG